MLQENCIDEYGAVSNEHALGCSNQPQTCCVNSFFKLYPYKAIFIKMFVFKLISMTSMTFFCILILQIQEISFKNYYTAYLTVRVLKNEEGSDESPAQWFTCVRNYCLMSSPHTEGGSQDYFSIYRQQVSLRYTSRFDVLCGLRCFSAHRRVII